MPTYLFYPRRADGVSLTFIAEGADNDLDALELASDIAAAHDCAGVFVWEAAADSGRDRFVGEVDRQSRAPHSASTPVSTPAGASAEA